VWGNKSHVYRYHFSTQHQKNITNIIANHLDGWSICTMDGTIRRAGVIIGKKEPRHDPTQCLTESCKGFKPAESTPYEYRPLETDHHIRLLHVYLGDGNEPLFCEIHHADLHDRPDYEALSYIWGDPVFEHRLNILPDQHFLITASLRDALSDLRLRIWVATLKIFGQMHVVLIKATFQNAINRFK
jgi:hypothetical protein